MSLTPLERQKLAEIERALRSDDLRLAALFEFWVSPEPLPTQPAPPRHRPNGIRRWLGS